jgi:hypothetical protein
MSPRCTNFKRHISNAQESYALKGNSDEIVRLKRPASEIPATPHRRGSRHICGEVFSCPCNCCGGSRMEKPAKFRARWIAARCPSPIAGRCSPCHAVWSDINRVAEATRPADVLTPRGWRGLLVRAFCLPRCRTLSQRIHVLCSESHPWCAAAAPFCRALSSWRRLR